jgi:hypothetical protein
LLICNICAETCQIDEEENFNTNFNLNEISDYSHQHYLTRGVITQHEKDNFEKVSTKEVTSFTVSLSDEYIYTLLVESSYFDILSRAPRWATHSGQDYHGYCITNSGTWLPQIVKWAIDRYTLKGERVLSNVKKFL